MAGHASAIMIFHLRSQIAATLAADVQPKPEADEAMLVHYGQLC